MTASNTLITTTIAGTAITDLARQFGTPLYVYDAARIVSQVEALQAAGFKRIRFAQKACSNISILQLVRQHGCLVDAVSAGEIQRAFLAGYPASATANGDEVELAPPIEYTADIFTRDALDLVVEHEISVNCGSPDMIRQLGERAPGRGIALRINPGFGHGHSQKTNTGGDQSKHGIWHEDLPTCIQIAAEFNLTIDRLHMHIGSGTDFEHLSQVCGAMEQAVATVGDSVRAISAGGGLPVPYQTDDEPIDLAQYYEVWDAARNRIADRLGHDVALEVEPGRFLTAESGYLIAEIRAIKNMGQNRFYVVDAGFHNLARPILYGAYHPMSIVPASGKQEDRAEHDVIVGGPLCESGDIFTQAEGGFVQSRRLPRAEVGDLLVISHAGAYGYCMSSNYNSHPLAAEVLLQPEGPQLIRRRQTFEELVGPETAVLPARN